MAASTLCNLASSLKFYFIVYLDDIIVFSQDISTHLQRLEMVFQKLREHGLTIEAKKCQFFYTKVTYLAGHVVSAGGVATNLTKTEVVINWPKPKTLKDLRSFLGFASYYQICSSLRTANKTSK